MRKGKELERSDTENLRFSKSLIEVIKSDEVESEEESLHESIEESGTELLNDLFLLRKWIEAQELMDQNMSDEMLKSFQNYSSCDNDLKDNLKEHFDLRICNSNFFRNRSPCVSYNKRITQPKVCLTTTPEDPKRLIFCCWFADKRFEGCNISNQLKFIFVKIDEIMKKHGLVDKVITIVFDAENVTEDHLASLTNYSAKVILEIFACFPAFCTILIVNGPAFINNFTSKFQQYLDQPMFKLLKDYDQLLKFIPPHYLPSDMGGASDCRSRDQLEETFMDDLCKISSYLAVEERTWEARYAVKLTTTPNPKTDAEPATIKRKKKKKLGKKKGSKKGKPKKKKKKDTKK